MKIVRVQALPREGFSHRPRAGRFFPSGEAVTLEVVDQEEDPTVEVDAVDSAGKAFKRQVPDPRRISKKVFEEMVMTDPVLRILADGETISVLSQAALDAARKQSGDLASELTDTKAKLAEAQHKLAAAHTRIAELEGQAKTATATPATPGEGEEHHKGRAGAKADDEEHPEKGGRRR